jgi:hypothetical protein
MISVRSSLRTKLPPARKWILEKESDGPEVIHQVSDKRFAGDRIFIFPANRATQAIAVRPVKEVIGVLRLRLQDNAQAPD